MSQDPRPLSHSQRRLARQMFMTDGQRSKLVMDTFIERAPDLSDDDLCCLATVSRQISGRRQLKSARIGLINRFPAP